MALAPEQLRRINLYVPAAVATALGTLPKLLGLREAIVALPGMGESLDKLEGYALAALYAHALTLPQTEGETALRALANEAAPLRERLLSSAEFLARFGLLDATHVAEIRKGTGYLDTAQDLTALAALFRASWPEVVSKSIVTMAEVDRAAELGPLLIGAFGRRQQGTEGMRAQAEAQDRLARAYTLFFNAYDDCRRAVSFVRWREGDADAFAPTLRPVARRSPPSGEGPGDGETPEPEPGSETPGGGAPGGVPGNDAPGDDAPGDDAPGGDLPDGGLTDDTGV
jgi:hypothetical protein